MDSLLGLSDFFQRMYITKDLVNIIEEYRIYDLEDHIHYLLSGFIREVSAISKPIEKAIREIRESNNQDNQNYNLKGSIPRFLETIKYIRQNVMKNPSMTEIHQIYPLIAQGKADITDNDGYQKMITEYKHLQDYDTDLYHTHICCIWKHLASNKDVYERLNVLIALGKCHFLLLFPELESLYNMWIYNNGFKNVSEKYLFLLIDYANKPQWKVFDSIKG